MPFRSQKQARFMFARHPRIAKRWAREYGGWKGLPKYARKKKSRSRRRTRRR